MTSKIVVNNIEPDSGISSVTFTSNITGEDSTQNISGINSVTATTYYGSGANLTGIDASSIKNGSDVKVQANSHGAVVTGILTANSFIGISSVTITNGTSSLNKHSVGIGTTDTAGRNAGVGTAVGTLVYNSQTKEVQVYNADKTWAAVYEEPFVATGGSKHTLEIIQFIHLLHQALFKSPLDQEITLNIWSLLVEEVLAVAAVVLVDIELAQDFQFLQVLIQ